MCLIYFFSVEPDVNERWRNSCIDRSSMGDTLGKEKIMRGLIIEWNREDILEAISRVIVLLLPTRRFAYYAALRSFEKCRRQEVSQL